MPETPSPRLQPLRRAFLWKLFIMLLWPFFVLGVFLVMVVTFLRIPFTRFYEDERGKIRAGDTKLNAWMQRGRWEP